MPSDNHGTASDSHRERRKFMLLTCVITKYYVIRSVVDPPRESKAHERTRAGGSKSIETKVQ